MIAYKFLRDAAIGTFSGFRWPRPADGSPGEWVETRPPLRACRAGVHACRTQDLPWWPAAELWEMELDGEVAVYEHKVVALRGRLLGRVERWTPELAQEYAHACAWRARDSAVRALERADRPDAVDRLARCAELEDLLTASRELAVDVPDARISLTIAGDGATRALTNAVATSAYIAAHAAGRIEGPAGIAAERRWQSAWLVEHLGLSRGE